ncbi:MAG: 23S rRNA (pseudouridine(1915)-N(3))-methyltransferase RlmH [Clostridia bacterium]|nr:23S rRNA (pseudouridine(1915)-N(3))-methyltransferase RlmH [Clostridia bacterium]
MNLTILAVGRLKEKFWQQAQNEYQKRLQAYLKLEIVEIPDESDNEHPEEVKAKEAQRILKRLNPDSFVIALERRGRQFSSEKLAACLDNLALKGKSRLTLLIGGSWGLDQAVLAKADLLLSFSELTFPHQLMRIILLEQIYRCCKINHNEPYHK